MTAIDRPALLALLRAERAEAHRRRDHERVDALTVHITALTERPAR